MMFSPAVVSDTPVFNAFVFGANQDNRTMNYLREQSNTFSQTLTDAGRRFMSKATEIYEKFNGAEAIRVAQAAIRKATNIFQHNTIAYLNDIGRIQQAPTVMYRYLMAEPTIREKYNNQLCEGYCTGNNAQYVDYDTGGIKDTHYDYRRVMNNICVVEDNKMISNTYIEKLRAGDRELEIGEQVDIIDTWKLTRLLILQGNDDPTSPLNNKL